MAPSPDSHKVTQNFSDSDGYLVDIHLGCSPLEKCIESIDINTHQSIDINTTA